MDNYDYLFDADISDLMNKKEDKNKITNVKLNKNIQNKLLTYQIDHVKNIVNCMKLNNIALDGSDTGTGKTYSSIAVCKQLNLKPFIICPKSIMHAWKGVCNVFEIEYLGIVNYETIRNGKYYERDTGKRIVCPYINNQKWNLPDNSIIIFDEAHRCRHIDTLNGQLLMSTKNNKNINVLLLSATIVDNLDDFRIYGYLLNFYKSMRDSTNWIIKYSSMNGINKELYPDKGSRMRISELGDLFPDNKIIVESCDCDQKIQKIYEKTNDELKNKNKNKNTNILTKIIKARQSIELLKVPIFIETCKDNINNGLSVVIFVNFTKTLEQLSEQLKTTCTIHGKQTLEQRMKNINDFNSDKERIIICNMQSGSQSINLHDTHGIHPRISLISPSFSSIDLIQALGRIVRANTKTAVIQKIILCANSIEDKIANNIKNKLDCISMLNDGDLNCFNFMKK
jgi:superfamily II DNA or RNA helicase